MAALNHLAAVLGVLGWALLSPAQSTQPATTRPADSAFNPPNALPFDPRGYSSSGDRSRWAGGTDRADRWVDWDYGWYTYGARQSRSLPGYRPNGAAYDPNRPDDATYEVYTDRDRYRLANQDRYASTYGNRYSFGPDYGVYAAPTAGNTAPNNTVNMGPNTANLGPGGTANPGLAGAAPNPGSAGAPPNYGVYGYGVYGAYGAPNTGMALGGAANAGLAGASPNPGSAGASPNANASAGSPSAWQSWQQRVDQSHGVKSSGSIARYTGTRSTLSPSNNPNLRGSWASSTQNSRNNSGQ